VSIIFHITIMYEWYKKNSKNVINYKILLGFAPSLDTRDMSEAFSPLFISTYRVSLVFVFLGDYDLAPRDRSIELCKCNFTR
jgi:hypothetical protein